MKKVLSFAFSALMLAGCAKTAYIDTDELPQGLTFSQYQCEGNKGFEIALDGDQFAYLKSTSKNYRLIRYPSASGMKYILDDGTKPPINAVTFTAKGQDSRLEIGSILFRNCSLNAE